jgi:hypothetical protein
VTGYLMCGLLYVGHYRRIVGGNVEVVVPIAGQGGDQSRNLISISQLTLALE